MGGIIEFDQAIFACTWQPPGGSCHSLFPLLSPSAFGAGAQDCAGRLHAVPGQRPVQGGLRFSREFACFCTFSRDWQQSLLVRMDYPRSHYKPSFRMRQVYFARQFPAYRPNSLLLDNALATMGAGLPSAIATKIVRPSHAVLDIVGDGGFMMASHVCLRCSGKHADPGKESCHADSSNTYCLKDPMWPALLASKNAYCSLGACLLYERQASMHGPQAQRYALQQDSVRSKASCASVCRIREALEDFCTQRICFACRRS